MEMYTCKWDRQLCFYMLYVVGLTAFVVHSILDQRSAFLMEFAEQLVIHHMEQRATNTRYLTCQTGNDVIRCRVRHLIYLIILFKLLLNSLTLLDYQPMPFSLQLGHRALCTRNWIKDSGNSISLHVRKKRVCQQHSQAKYESLECRKKPLF